MKKITTHTSIESGESNSINDGAVKEAIISERKKITNLFKKFKAFSEGQQYNHLGWTAFAIAAQVCVVALITLVAIDFNGNRFALWIPVIVTTFIIEVTNLSAMPTKITIPAFFISVLINISVLV